MVVPPGPDWQFEGDKDECKIVIFTAWYLQPGLENRYYGRGDPLRSPRDTLYQLKLALTSPTGCGRSVGVVRLRTITTEFSFMVSANGLQIRLDEFLRLIYCRYKPHFWETRDMTLRFCTE
jgi:hypothetical protein